MLMVVFIISLMVGIAFPAISSGVDSLRLRGAGEEAATLLSAAMNRAERRRIAVEIAVFPEENSMVLTSVEPGYRKVYRPGDGITIAGVVPRLPSADPRQPRRFLVFPGGSVPRVGVLLTNARGTRRLVRLDPITGVAESRMLEPNEELLP
jgi:hypothetical protein